MAISLSGEIVDPSGRAVESTSIPTVTSPTSSIPTDTFLNELQKKLLAQSDIISSQDTAIESAISKAIEATKAGQEAGAKRVELSFERQISEARKRGTEALTATQESQRGFGINTAALKQITTETDKNIKDLEMRKQELLLAGDVASAARISDLQLQSLQFKQQAVQQTFSNLLSLGGLALQQKQLSLAERQQTTTERQAVANIALKYGLEVKEGDTIDTITARAMPFASQEQKLQLAKAQADIKLAEAQAAKALRGDGAINDSLTLSLIADQALKDPSILNLIKSPEDAAKVKAVMEIKSKPRIFGRVELISQFTDTKRSGIDYNTALVDLMKQQGKILNFDEAKQILNQVYGIPEEVPTKKGALTGIEGSFLLEKPGKGLGEGLLTR